MIDVQAVIRDVPHFDAFCSVEKLHGLAERLRADSRFDVDVTGSSRNGLPIYHGSLRQGVSEGVVCGRPARHGADGQSNRIQFDEPASSRITGRSSRPVSNGTSCPVSIRTGQS